VLPVPKRLRYFMQRGGAALNMVMRIFLRVIAQTLQTPCGQNIKNACPCEVMDQLATIWVWALGSCRPCAAAAQAGLSCWAWGWRLWLLERQR